MSFKEKSKYIDVKKKLPGLQFKFFVILKHLKMAIKAYQKIRMCASFSVGCKKERAGIIIAYLDSTKSYLQNTSTI